MRSNKTGKKKSTAKAAVGFNPAMSRFVTAALLATCPTQSTGLQVPRYAPTGPTGIMHEAPLARYSDVHVGPTHIFGPISLVRGGGAGICAPSNTWFSRAADEDASDTVSVGSVDADTEVPQAPSKVMQVSR